MGLHMKIKNKISLLFILILLISIFVLGYGILGKGEKQPKEWSIGERFQHETSLTWRGVAADLFRASPKTPPLYKSYPEVKMEKLPKPGNMRWSRLKPAMFVPHRYSACATLCLAAVHVYLNFSKIWNYLHRKIRRN